MLLSKIELRKKYREVRRNTENKAEKDELIFSNLFKLDEFLKSDLILCYASKADEIFTDKIINYSLDCGKRVAVPCCSDNSGNMDFYLINSFDELKIGYFGIREPDTHKCEKVKTFSEGIVIVPALCYDKRGYRVGFGGGYYDRFLKNHPLFSLGLCYNSCVLDEIPNNNYDASVNIIVTESDIIYCKDGGKNG